MMTRGQEYVDRSIDEFESARQERQIRNLKRNAKSLGFSVTQEAQESAA